MNGSGWAGMPFILFSLGYIALTEWAAAPPRSILRCWLTDLATIVIPPTGYGCSVMRPLQSAQPCA